MPVSNEAHALDRLHDARRNGSSQGQGLGLVKPSRSQRGVLPRYGGQRLRGAGGGPAIRAGRTACLNRGETRVEGTARELHTCCLALGCKHTLVMG